MYYEYGKVKFFKGKGIIYSNDFTNTYDIKSTNFITSTINGKDKIHFKITLKEHF